MVSNTNFVKDVVSSIKYDSFELARQNAIPVSDRNKITIGSLIPVGPWILKDREKIELICQWRKSAMKMFLAQFDSTYDRTFNYLKNFSIGQEDRIFFLIYDDKERFIGHIGLSNLSVDSGELDNMVRGRAGGNPHIIYFSETSLLAWAFDHLGIVESKLRVLSYNWTVIALHERVGYQVQNQFNLFKRTENGLIFHDVVSDINSNVNYQCVEMKIKRDSFFKKNEWLAPLLSLTQPESPQLSS